jgi:hypothetical protein
VVRYAPDGNEQDRQLLPPDGIDWRVVARAVRARANSPASIAPNSEAVGAAPQAIPLLPDFQVVASARASQGNHFPWVAAGLVAGAVALGLSLHSTNAVLLGPETPRP